MRRESPETGDLELRDSDDCRGVQPPVLAAVASRELRCDGSNNRCPSAIPCYSDPLWCQAFVLTYWHRLLYRAVMPRKPRVEYCGAFYHVITRENQRQSLFHDDKDREFYLDRLEQYLKR